MDRRPNRLHVWLLTFALALAATAVRSPAQIVDIPDSVRTAVSVGDADKAAIKAYVEANSKNLLDPDPAKAEALRRDRTAILEKLKDLAGGGAVTVSFRLAYNTELTPILQNMLASPSEKIVINGLVIAGELATDASLQLVQSKLDDKAPAVRYEAAVSLGRIFRVYARTPQRAINEGQVGLAVRGIEPQLAKEENPFVRDALIRAALDAATIAEARPAAITSVSKGTLAVIRAAKHNPPSEPELAALLRAGVGLRNLATQAVQQGLAVPESAARDAAECSGLLLASIARLLEKAPAPSAVQNRSELLQLASSAVNTVELCSQLLGARTAVGINVADTLGKGTKNGDAQFTLDVKNLVGEGGKLTKSPWNIPADRFK